jgi:hypothetical protein
MPFTTAHPAIVLPLKQWFPRWFSLTGLMAGAIAPDLVYFLTLRTDFRGLSHSWLGLFFVCLPAGTIFCLVFHRYFKYPFIRHLPLPLDKFLSGLAQSGWRVVGTRGWVILVGSVLVGSLSHFFWDAFTHPTGQIASHWPLLQQKIMLMGRPRLACRILQHASTVAGTLMIVLYAVKGDIIPKVQVVEVKSSAREKRMFWMTGGIVALGFAIAAMVIFNALFRWGLQLGHGWFLAVQTFGLSLWAGFFYWTIIYGLVKRQSVFALAKTKE